MRLVPLGVRGSTPAPGPEYIRYGGHTSCVAVIADGADQPHLVLDAGTGITALGSVLGDAPFSGRIVLTHLHWDHVHGLPFCRSVDRDDARVTLSVPVQAGEDPVALLSRSFSPPHFPITPHGLRGDWRFEALTPGSVDETVRVVRIPHKGGVTYGIRVDIDGVSAAYLPDHAPADADSDELADLLAGVDVLMHDGQFVATELELARAFGHATIDQAAALADRVDVGALVLTHYAPRRTDAELDRLRATWTQTPEGRPLTFAAEREPIEVAAVSRRSTSR